MGTETLPPFFSRSVVWSILKLFLQGREQESVFKHKNDKLSYDRIIFSYTCRKNAYTDLTWKVLDIITAIALYSNSLKKTEEGFIG